MVVSVMKHTDFLVDGPRNQCAIRVHGTADAWCISSLREIVVWLIPAIDPTTRLRIADCTNGDDFRFGSRAYGKQVSHRFRIEEGIIVEEQVKIGICCCCRSPSFAHTAAPVKIAVAGDNFRIGPYFECRFHSAVRAPVVDQKDIQLEAQSRKPTLAA
jgi:hypothetical protein